MKKPWHLRKVAYRISYRLTGGPHDGEQGSCELVGTPTFKRALELEAEGSKMEFDIATIDDEVPGTGSETC